MNDCHELTLPAICSQSISQKIATTMTGFKGLRTWPRDHMCCRIPETGQAGEHLTGRAELDSGLAAGLVANGLNVLEAQAVAVEDCFPMVSVNRRHHREVAAEPGLILLTDDAAASAAGIDYRL